MEIYRDLRNIRPETESVLSIGSFDGVHKAHQEIIRQLNLVAGERGWQQTIVTFSPHPQLVVQSRDDAPLLLTDDDEKAALLEAAGIKRMVIIPFDHSVAAMGADQFLREILQEQIGFRKMIIGYNLGFGNGRSGNRDTLKLLGKRLGYELEVIPPLLQDEVRISSTQVRKRLLQGDLDGAAAMLGRPHFFSGRIIRGAGRGGQMGFPTLNMEIEEERKLLPPAGVYIVRALVEDQRYLSILNLGDAPTFGRNQAIPELHLLEYDTGAGKSENVKVELLRWLRSIRKFENSEQLIAQLRLDRSQALEFDRADH